MEANECLNGVPGTSSNVVGITIINEPMAADMANHLAVDAATSTTAATPSPEASTQLMVAVSFTSAMGNVLPTVTSTNILLTATAIATNEPDSFKNVPNAAESMLNQLMNGVPAGTPASSAPDGQLPQQTPALGIARGRRRV
jgi:hypothetical protein